MSRVLLAKARSISLEQGAFTPPVGIMYLAAVLREFGHVPRLYEVGHCAEDLSGFRSVVRAFNPDVVGISALSLEAGVMHRMAAVAKEVGPDVPVVVGGPHPTSFPDRCLADANIDYAVRGEAEVTIVELVAALTRGGAPAGVRGVVSRSPAGAALHALPREPVSDLDTLPIPAWDLVDLDFYSRNPSMAAVGRRPYLVLVTSRGCPYKCIYCHRVHGKRYRSRSPERVLGEVETLVRSYGIREFEVLDDNFNLDRQRFRQILDGLASRRSRLCLLFPNGLRADLLNEEDLRSLLRAGTTFLSVAIETAVPRLQSLIRKELCLEVVRRNIDLAVDLGMYVNGFFMLGFPTETLEEASATVAFAVNSRLHQALFFNVVPFGGTDLGEMTRNRLQGAAEPSDSDYHRGRVNVSAMTDAELYGLQREAYRRFYLDPTRLARIVAAHPRRWSLPYYGLMTVMKLLPKTSRFRT